MSGKKGRSGGARSGAGRPKKKRPPTAHKYEDAVAYLAAVVEGTEEPDAVRVNAARSLLPYQAPRKRAPVASAPRANYSRQHSSMPSQPPVKPGKQNPRRSAPVWAARRVSHGNREHRSNT
jgi:hypothetical protein